MKRPLRHIIKDFTSELNLTFKILSSSIDADTTILKVENTLHLKAGQTVIVDTVEYEVLSILDEETLIINDAITSPINITYPTLIFLAGTPLFICQQLTSVHDPLNKYPFIYLYEIIEESFSLVASDKIERQSQVKLFFLDETASTYEETENMQQYYDKVVDRMYRVANYFIEKANNSKYFSRIEDKYRLKLYPKFGAFSELKGVNNSIFNDLLSGVELTVNLPVLKEFNC